MADNFGKLSYGRLVRPLIFGQTDPLARDQKNSLFFCKTNQNLSESYNSRIEKKKLKWKIACENQFIQKWFWTFKKIYNYFKFGKSLKILCFFIFWLIYFNKNIIFRLRSKSNRLIMLRRWSKFFFWYFYAYIFARFKLTASGLIFISSKTSEKPVMRLSFSVCYSWDAFARRSSIWKSVRRVKNSWRSAFKTRERSFRRRKNYQIVNWTFYRKNSLFDWRSTKRS